MNTWEDSVVVGFSKVRTDVRTKTLLRSSFFDLPSAGSLPSPSPFSSSSHRRRLIVVVLVVLVVVVVSVATLRVHHYTTTIAHFAPLEFYVIYDVGSNDLIDRCIALLL